MTQKAILNAVARHYEDSLAAHGPSSRGVDWKDEASHHLRHVQFLRLLGGDSEASVLDLGCGYGDFLPFLRAEGHRGPYVGYDVAPGMIDRALATHRGVDRCEFHVGADPRAPCDYAVASGVLNVRRGADEAAWVVHVRDVMEALARLGRRGFGFNVLSTSSDPDRRCADLYYADPIETLRFCLARFGRHVCLLQDYGLWEFTVLVRHASLVERPNAEAR